MNRTLLLLPLLAIGTLFTACQPPAAQRRDLEMVEKSLEKVDARLEQIERALAEAKVIDAAKTAAAQPAEEVVVYVTGAVKNAGRVDLPKGATAYAALAAAGGPNELARKDITVTRASEADIPLTPLEQKDFTMESGDVITVTQTVF